jgi:hypothetical protein
MSLSTCKRCGHRPVCHRYGKCEFVAREGWNGLYGTFAKETPCTCEAWQGPKKP